MSQNHNEGKIRGEILLLDAQGEAKKTAIANCLELYASGGETIPLKFDEEGNFEAELSGKGPFSLRAILDNEQCIFAFEKTSPRDVMPVVEITVEGGEESLQLFAWVPVKASFGHDPEVDVQFARDTAKGCVALHDALIQEGKSPEEAWKRVQNVLGKAFNSRVTIELPCKTCTDRYYMPGTPYYMNFPAYNTCMTRPPCY